MIAPFLVQLGQTVKFSLEIIHRRIRLFLGAGIKCQICRRFSGISRFCGGSRAVAALAFLHVRLLDFRFFQDRILLQFLFYQCLELQRGRLEQRQRLLELRCQHQRLR